MIPEQNIVKLGILCNSTDLSNWQLKIIQELLKVEGVQLFLLIAEPLHLTNKKLSRWKRFSNFLFHFYNTLSRKKMESMRKADDSFVLQEIESISCTSVLRKGLFQFFTNESIEKIKSYGLSAILQFTPYILKGKILDACPYGVWTFYHDQIERYGAGSACFWEIYRGGILTRTALYQLTSKRNKGILLQEGFFSTIQYSYPRQKDRTYFLCADWPARVCKDILNHKIDALKRETVKLDAYHYRPPSNIQMIRFFMKMMKNKWIHQCRRICLSETWNAGIVDAPIYTFLTDSSQNQRVYWLPKPRKGTLIADPFGIEKGDRLSLLVEDFDYAIGKGEISAIEGIRLAKRGVLFDEMRMQHSVIPSWRHLSYPYLIRYEGEIYCIPETHQMREVAIYKAEEYPAKWEKVCVITEGSAIADATVIQHDGYWWLFGTDCDVDSSSKLYLWYAEDLFGHWKEHPQNPVKSDVRSSRPAGTPFFYKGQLYRPAQDCSKTYGGRIAINRVLQLTTTEFKEEVAIWLNPYEESPYPHGIHTISSVGDKTIIDSKKITFDIYHFVRRLKRYLRE